MSRARQDRVISAGGQTGHAASFVLPGGSLFCVQEAPGTWHCAKVDRSAGPNGPDVCTTRSGAPARISDGSSSIELTSLTTAVADSVFRPPAAAG